jgi:putative NIF3 family GTP cyclohydrolase 1 type 2
MTTINDLISHTESLTGHPINRDEGVHFGPAERDVTGVTVCWMATPDAIRAAGEAGHELLIGHESLFFPYDVVNAESSPSGWEEWQVNAQRSRLLAETSLTHLRLHGSVDEICIFDDFAEILGLGEPVYADGFVKIFQMPPRSIRSWAEQVQETMGMNGLRIAGVTDMDQTGMEQAGMDQVVSRIGLPWGGLGLFVNVGYQQKLIEQGCDLFIAGESDNYGFRFAQECGIPMIETSHEICENPGLAHFTEMLAETFPQVDFLFYENPCVWSMYSGE